MPNVDQIVVPIAFVLLLLAIALTATWRTHLKPWWATLTWTPRLTPGVRAQVIMVMGDDGKVYILFDKLAPEENVSQIFAMLTEQWFAVGSQMGVTLNITTRSGYIRETPEGPEFIVDLVRKVPKEATVRPMTDAEEAIAHAAD